MKNDSFTIKRENVETIINAFKTEFHPTFEYTSKSGNFKILVYEEYNFWRTNSTLSAILLFDLEDKDWCNINIVLAGGAYGPLQLYWGADKSLLNKIKRFFQKFGYEKSWKEV